MKGEECEYLDLLYEYLRSHFGSPSDPTPSNLEEKKRLLDEFLKRYLEHDNILRRQFETYLEILDLRQKLLKELSDYSDSAKALCKGDLDEKMHSFFLNSLIERLVNLLEICGKLKATVDKATDSEGEKASNLLIYWIQDNHRKMVNRLQETINIFEKKLEKLSKKLNKNRCES